MFFKMEYDIFKHENGKKHQNFDAHTEENQTKSDSWQKNIRINMIVLDSQLLI